MKNKTVPLYKPGGSQLGDRRIEKVVEVPHESFRSLKVSPPEESPLMGYAFIAENRSSMFSKGGVTHCLLVLEQDSSDGVLIDSEDQDYPCYAAYVPRIRDSVDAEIARAADLIIWQGTETSADESRRVRFEDLEERLGLIIREGNGLDAMLKSALKRRPEVASADIRNGRVEVEYHPGYCRQPRRGPEDSLPDLRVKDILPLLKGGTVFLCHEEAERAVLAENLRLLTGVGREDYAVLLDARIASIKNRPDGMEVVLTDVDPKELARFNEAYDAFIEAEQAMGPKM